MTLQLIVTREARADIAEAIGWFRKRSPELPDRFRVELERVYSRIQDYPEIYPIVYKRFRRALLRKFPYSVFYIVDPAILLIVGVVHQARDESSWKRRA